jgi:predicted Zn finger-like uncharacterized protein
MKVQCPKCRSSYKLPKDRVPSSGSVKVKCKSCGNVIEVTAAAASAATGADEPSTEASAASLVPVAEPIVAASVAPEAPVASAREVKWYLASGNERVGPFSADDVRARLDTMEVNLDSLAWRKGFAGWTRLGDIEDFRSSGHPAEVSEPTRLMGANESPVGSAASVSGNAAGSDDGSGGAAPDPESMVFQRKETSVLFSLDDYKSRKSTRSQPSMLPVEASLSVAPVEPLVRLTPVSSGQARPSAPRVGVISLDEGEIRHVAEALTRRKNQRRNVLIGVAVAAGLVVVGVAVGLVVSREPAPIPVASPAVTAPSSSVAPVAASQVPPAVADPVAGVAKSPEAVQAPVAATPVAKAVDKGKEASRETKKAEKGKADGAAASVPVQAATPAVAPAKAAPASDDANALLAALSKGRDASAGKAPVANATAAASGADDSLPAQLSIPEIQSTLRKKQAALQECVRGAGIPLPFRANPRITVSGSGSVTSVSAAGTAGAQGCIEATLRSTSFRRFKGDDMTVQVPIAVQ